ncbi:MAG: Ig-like domain-containing protein [Cellulomonas sp.]
MELAPARRATRIFAIAASAALAMTLSGIASSPALAGAATSSVDIVQALPNQGSAQYGQPDWRDFGTTRTFTRIALTSSDAQTPALEYYDWGTGAWTPFWTAAAAFSGAQTVTLGAPQQASKIRVVPSSVTIAGVYNDSPIAATTSIAITTTVTVPPSLPAHLDVAQDDGGSLLLPITWETVPLTQYGVAGSYTVHGTYAADGVAGIATAAITVTQEKGIIELSTPYMGWNHWYALYMSPTDTALKAQVEAMKQRGLTDVGYDIVWVDEGWWGNSDNPNYRDGNGNMIPGPKFHGDIKAFGDWVHAQGLKFGLYTDTGVRSCGGYFGSGGDNWFENFRKDVAQFKAWGVDAIKLDHCGGHNDSTSYMATNAQVYAAFYQAMRAEDPEGTMIFDTCEWGQEAPGDWAYKIANAWRTDGDLGTPALDDAFLDTWEHNLNRQASGPGDKGWNDPDYLTIDAPGNKMTPAQFRTYFTLWAISASPLILSQDITQLKPENLATLKNPDMIAIDQDPLGEQPTLVRQDSPGLQVWSKPLAAKDGKSRVAVMLLNRSKNPATFGLDWSDAGLKNVTSVHNVWEDTDGATGTGYQGLVFPMELTVLVAEGASVDATPGFPTVNYAPQSLIVAPSGSNQYQRSQAAADYRTDTYWKPNFNDLDGSQWIEADLGRPLPVGEVDLVMQASFTAASQVDYWDGSVWKMAATAPSLSGTAVFTLSPAVTTTKVRWRAPGGGRPQVRELQVYPPQKNNASYTNLSQIFAAPNPNLAQRSDVQCFSSSDWPGYGCDKLTDGVVQNGTSSTAAQAAGRWNSGNPGNNELVGLTWGTPVAAGVQKTLQLTFGSWWHRETRSVVEYRASEQDPWTQLAVVAATPAAGEVQAQDVMELDLTSQTVKQVRLRFTEVVETTGMPWSGSPYPTFWEIALNTAPQPPSPLVARTATVETKAGRAPAMPSTADVRLSDGSWTTLPVTWSAIAPSAYAGAGEFFVTGVVDGTSVAADAKVTVLPRPSTRAELQALYDANKDKAQGDYAASGWPAFAAGLAGADAVLHQSSPSSSEIVVAATALQDAADALAYVKDLRALVGQLGGLGPDGFLPDTWPALPTALTAARQVADDPDATPAQVDAAYRALSQAVSGLHVANIALAPHASAKTSSDYSSGYDASKINDGNDTTRWNAKPQLHGDGGWAELDWPHPVTANWASLVLHQWAGRAELAHVQYLAADSQWVTLATFATQPTAGQYQSQDVVQLPLGNVTFSSLRVFYEKTASYSGGDDPSIWEFQVYDWPVLSVEPVTVSTTAGTPADLPATVTSTLANLQVATARVAWDAVPADSWLTPGTFDVAGTVPGSDVRATAHVTVAPLAPTTAPSITGTPEVMGLLTANPGTWPLPGLSFGYQWNTSGVPIAGATTATLPVTAALSGASVTITVTALENGHALGSATSDPVTVTAVPAWAAQAVYDTGARVLHDGRLFEAQWWTQNQTPGSSPWLAWAEVGTTVRCTADVTARQWTDSWVFTGGETVVHDGALWTARWWTRNQEPGQKNGPWATAGSCP